MFMGIRCHSPYYITLSGEAKMRILKNKIPVGCGKCVYCKKRRVSSWVFRLLQEELISSSSYFVTLTYEDRHLPRTKSNYATLDKTDFQKFMKRLRKINTRKIRYYAVGEYGTKHWRPHYHAIMFNIDDIDYLQKAWQAVEPNTDIKSQIGDIHVGNVTSNSIAYTAKYIDKEKKVPTHKRDDRQREFSLMSNGLGANYLTPQIIKWHKADLKRMYCVLPDGIKVAMPKYYRDRIFSQEEKDKQRVFLEQLEKKENKELREQFDYLYKNNDITFETYVEQLKYGETAQYYAHNKKIRK